MLILKRKSLQDIVKDGTRKIHGNDLGYHEGNYDYEESEYEGTYAHDVAGYDDDTISDAFDGDPEAYWNID